MIIAARLAAQVLERAHVARGRQPAERHREQQDHHDARARNWAWTGPTARRRWPRSPTPCLARPRTRCRPGMPIASAITIAIAASSSVTGSFSAISAVTGFCMRSDSPRSPCSTPPTQYDVAHRQRLVEVHLLAQVRDHVRIALLARQHHRRIAGQQLLQPEDQHRDEEQRRDDRRERGGRGSAHSVGRSSVRACSDAAACLTELQPLHAHQAVGNRAQAGQLGRVRPQPVAVVQIDDRPVLEHDRGDLLVRLAAAPPDRASVRDRLSSSSTSGLQ